MAVCSQYHLKHVGGIFPPALALVHGVVVMFLATLTAAPAAGTRYVTTPLLEPDRCATAWVISRYVDPGARFEFFKRGKIPENVTRYDLPEAVLKRDARRATVEVLIQVENLQDPVVLQLGEIIHDIEINAWARRQVPGSLMFQQTLMEAMQAEPSVDSALRACFNMLDAFRAMDGDIGLWLDKFERGAKNRSPE